MTGNGPLGIPDADWIAISAGGVILAAAAQIVAAVVTGFMAWFTRNLARETTSVAIQTQALAVETGRLVSETRALVEASSKERAQLEVHHQQSLNPIVLIGARCFKDASRGQWHLVGEIRNIGSGPATDIQIILQPDVGPAGSKVLGALAAGETRTLDLMWGDETAGTREVTSRHSSLTIFKSIFGWIGAVNQFSHSGLADDVTITELIWPSESSESQVRELTTDKFSGSTRPMYGTMKRI